MNIIHPYLSGPCVWRRGNLHAHTTESDGTRAPQELIDRYAELEYDFLAITDHDMITDPTAFDPRGMTLIPGNEVTIRGPHTVHIGAQRVIPPHVDRQRVLDEVDEATGFAFMAHPNWEVHFDHCPMRDLERLAGYAGIEIYNGLVRAHEGSPAATDKWDRLLGAGKRVWGYANDDAHFAGDEGVAWNMLQSDARDAASLIAALRAGRSYAGTGVVIREIEVADGAITIETDNADCIVVFADYGRRLCAAEDSRITFTPRPEHEATYVRFECYGRGEEMAWTQPFFLSE